MPSCFAYGCGTLGWRMLQLPTSSIQKPGREVKRVWIGMLDLSLMLCEEVWECSEVKRCLGRESEAVWEPKLAWPIWGAEYDVSLVSSSLAEDLW